ncbi:MAG: S8 family serine peptidase [Bacteroidetes bacterium]|nr:S8 family serine peptidase [Bacteroidota bacterium]
MLHLDDAADVDSVVTRWSAVPGVRYVQRNHRYRLDALSMMSLADDYDDPQLDSLNHLPVIRAAEAWQVTTGAATVRVGVVDTGLFLDHPDFDGQLWVNEAEDLNGNGRFDPSDLNQVDDDGNGYVDDVIGYDFVDRTASVEPGDYFERDPDPSEDNLNQGGQGHGTIVAGAIGAGLDNGVGGSGVAPGSRLVPLRAFGADGLGEDDDIAAAIVYAAQEGLDVLNLSFGDVYESPLMREAIRYATSQGTVVVASGGNLGGDAPHYPSDYTDVLGVAWLTADGSSIAGRGAHGLGIDLGAPGTAIYTTTLPAPSAPNPEDVTALYGRRSGSSMAAPLVAGAAALLKTVDPDLTPDAIRSILTSTAVDIDTPGWDHRTGAGRLDVAAAVRRALPAQVTLDHPPHNATLADDAIPIVGSVVHPRFTSFTVDVQVGDEDPRGDWQRLAGPVEAQTLNDTLAVWSLAAVEDTTYTLRLAAQLNDGTTVEDRRRVFVDRTPPEVDVRVWERALVDGRWGIAVDAATDDLTALQLTVATASDTTMVFSDRRARRHGLVWTDDEGYGGPAEATLQARNGAGLRTTRTSTFSLPDRRTRPGLFEVDDLGVTHGYLMPQTTDLDGDQLAELIYNRYEQGWVGDTLVVAEWDGESLRRVQQLIANVIPRDVGDTDGDGLREVLTQVAGATLVFEQGGPEAFLESVAFIDTTGLANPFDSLAAFGAGLTDLDGDGRGEILVHNTRQWRLLEYDGADYVEVTRLGNPTGVGPSELSTSEFSTPQVVTDDFDGDGRRDLLVGDTDGDWIWYEARGDNRLDPVWTFETERYNASARMTHGDFDGDGLAEFVTHTQPWTQPTRNNEREPAFGVYYVWDAIGDDASTLDARWILPGQSARHGALAALDVDGDGHDELAIAHPPHLYVMQRQADGAWHLIYHRRQLGTERRSGVRSAALTVADLDRDGREELIVGAGDERLYRLRPSGESLNRPPPPRWILAVSEGAASVRLAWEAFGADSVVVYSRETASAAFDPLTSSTGSSLIVQTDREREYALGGWHDGAMTGLSAVRQVRPHAPAVVQSISYPAPATAELVFSEPLAPDLAPEQFHLSDGSHPMEVLPGQQHRSITLRFSEVQAGPDTLFWQQVRDREGMPVASRAAPIAWPEPPDATLIVENWTIEQPGTIHLTFSDPLEGADLTAERYRLEPSGQVLDVAWTPDRPTEVQVTTSGRALGPTGLDTYLVVEGIRSTNGKRMPAGGQSIALTRPATSLSEAYVFPNPHDERRHPPRLMVAGVPRGATVRILTAQGTFVRALKERDGNGGVPWDLLDQDGRRVPSGVYLVRIESEGEAPVLLKAAIVR